MTSRGICAPDEPVGYVIDETADWVVYPLRVDEGAQDVPWGEALRRAREETE